MSPSDDMRFLGVDASPLPVEEFLAAGGDTRLDSRRRDAPIP